MANQNNTASNFTKQHFSEIYDRLYLRFSQLKSTADILTSSLHPDNTTVYKKSTQYDVSSMVEELILEIEYLVMVELKGGN